jgi:two-component system, OmpR family, sensor histidine kinase SenX3
MGVVPGGSYTIGWKKMRIISRRKAIVSFLSLGVFLAAVAVAVGSGWIILNWREGLKVFLGVIFFGGISAGLILNTIFLVREIRRNEQHDSFINAVTHELKTPITSIRLYVETLQRREVDENQRHEFYRLMLLDTERLLRTVEQVLRAGRAGHKLAPRNVTEVDLLELAEQCIEESRVRYHLQTGALRMDAGAINGSPVVVKGDAEELRTAISNMLDNAIKYSEKDVQVSVRFEPATQRRVLLRVSDRGVGIPPQELKRIFKRFYRVPNRALAKVKGTGLGLFIVRSIAARHGGKVFAESAGEGQGTTVTLQLPRSMTQ